MVKKTVTVDSIDIAVDDWNLQLGKYVAVYLVQKALKNDNEAEDLLNALGVTLFDNNNVQIWPPVQPSPMGGPN